MEAKDVKRRLVQSTLFPRAKSSIKGGENYDGNRGEEVAEEEREECGGSKKRSGSRRKGNSKSKATPRASPKKGEPLCVFYSRYGICKFRPSCKFDHPMRVFAYNAAASSSSIDSPAVRRFLASSSSPGNIALSFSGLVEASPTHDRRLSLSEARQKSLGNNNNINSE